MKITLNIDKKIVDSIKNRLKITGNQCPCIPENEWNEDTKCPCKKLREEQECCCGLYIKENN
jgi:ferredoxin-thioredoxin reductase catalytic subunit